MNDHLKNGEQHNADYTVTLSGRYNAILSILPYLVLALALFFGAAYALVLMIMKDAAESFRIVFMPFLMGSSVLLPLGGVFLFMIRWHGKRRIEADAEGITMVLPNEKSVYVPWEYLLAVELRFNKPRMVQVTLVSAALRFSFSAVEFNLSRPQSLKRVFMHGFELDKIREFLYYLHRNSPKLSWRMSQPFKEQFNIFYPPYDLEKLK